MAGGSPDHQSRHRNPASESEDNGRAAVTLDMAASPKAVEDAAPRRHPWGTPTTAQESRGRGLSSPGRQPRGGGCRGSAQGHQQRSVTAHR